MSDRTKAILGYIGIGLAAALIAGGLIWAIMSARVTDANERADEALEQVSELESRIDSLSAGLAAEDAEPPAESPDAPAGEAAADETPASSDSGSNEDGRHFCYVRDIVNETGTTMITVDYADFLTGDEAADAAAAAGEESPPPNDFFIRNVNPMLRTFPVESGISVTLRSSSSGIDADGYTVPLGQWQDFFIGMTGDMEVVRVVPYWIEIEDGVVVSVEEQYLP